MTKEYLGLYPNKREGGIYSDEPEYQKKIEEIYKLKARIADLEHLVASLNDEASELRKLFEMCAQLAEAHKGCEISRSEGMPCETGKELAVAIRKLGGIQ